MEEMQPRRCTRCLGLMKDEETGDLCTICRRKPPDEEDEDQSI